MLASPVRDDCRLYRAGFAMILRTVSPDWPTMHAPTAAIAPISASFKEVWLISLGHGLTHWYPATFYLLLPIIGKELGLSYTQIGFIMTVQHAVGAIANIPGGAIVDAMGRKGLLMAISLFWIGFPYLLMAFTHSYWMR